MMSSLLAALLIFYSPSIRAETDIASPEIVRLEAKLKQELSGKSDGSISPQDYEVFVAEYRLELAQTVKTLPASPANIEVHARILVLLGDAELATKRLQEALSTAPKNDELTLALGRNYLEKADYSSALSAAEAVLERDPKNEAALFLKYSSLDRVTRTDDPAATLPRGAVEQPRSERTAVAAMTRSRRASEIDVPLNTEAGDAGSGKNPRPLWPLAVPIGVGLIGYGVSRKNSTWVSEDGLDPAPHVPDDNAARNWRRSAAVAGAAFIGLAAWEFGPAAWSAAEGFIASGTPPASLTPSLAGGGAATGSVALNPGVAAAGANALVATSGALGLAKLADEHYSYSKPEQNNRERPHGEYKDSPKHGTSPRSSANGEVSSRPTDGQAALDRSTQVKPTSPRRVGVDPVNDEIVVLDRTAAGEFHGHVRHWNALTDQMKNALIKAGLVDSLGKVLKQ